MDDLLQRARSAIGRGERAQVEALLSQLQQRGPEDPRVLELAAVHWAKAGQRERSLAQLSKAQAVADLSVQQLCAFARVAHGWGELARAASFLQRAVALAPDDAQAWLLLAYVRAGAQEWLPALAAMRRAHELDPVDSTILERLVDLEFDYGVPRQALPLLTRWAHDHPGQVDAQLKLGVVLGRLGRHADAVQHYRQVAARMPGAADIWMALGQSLEYLGDQAASAQAYRQALALRPAWPLPLSGLLGLSRRSPDPALMACAEHMLATAVLSDAERAILGYELGKCLDAAKQPEKAMAAWQQANAARVRQIGKFDATAVRTLVHNTEQVFAHQVTKGHVEVADASGVVLIVGMPRSGTTLVEQILHAHPQAHGAGELLDLTLMGNQLRVQEAGWPEALRQSLPAPLRDALRAEYLQSLRAHAHQEARCLVDKAPLNFFFLGLAAELFPDLKVIWCRRDPRDVALSIFAENFSLDAPFAASWEGIAEYMAAEARLMALWQKVLPNPIFELHYRALVDEPEVQARALLRFVGLPWDPACLSFHTSATTVQTPSRWQVRQPINRNGLERWKAHEEALQPFVAHMRALGLPLAT